METANVFCQLRSLARRLDQGVVEIQDKISNPKQDLENCQAHAYKHLQSMKKEVHTLKDEARENLASVQIANNRFQQLLHLLPQVMELQKQSLTSIEEYIHQYGYVGQVKKVPSDKSEKEVTGETTPSNDDVGEDGEEDDGTDTNNAGAVTETNLSTPPTQAKPSQCKTPCLEDFGISSLTLNMIKRGGAFTTTHNTVQSQMSAPKYDAFSMEESPTPASFKHNGLLVTPSLMGGRSILEQTPDCTRIGFGIPHLQFMEDSPASFMAQRSIQKTGQYQQSAVPHNIGSPVPPILYTPGAKQINKKLYQEEVVKKNTATQDFDSPIPPLLMTPGAKQITSKIDLPDISTKKCKVTNDSPAVPVFMTPGAKQIQKTLSMPQPPAPVSQTDWDKEPEMPELTLSLQDITQLTQSFRLNQSSIPQPPEPPVAQSDRFKDRETPPLPELLSARLAQMGALPGTPSTTASSHISRDNTISATILNVTKDITPPPPKLLGKYSFLSKNHESRENIPPYGQ